MIRYFFITLFLLMIGFSANPAFAQEIHPSATFYSISDNEEVTLAGGESKITQAPCEITFDVKIDNPKNYNYVCEWVLKQVKDKEEKVILDRFEEQTQYTLTQAGGYDAKCYVTFSLDGDTVQCESENIHIVISESKLKCPDGFSPNGDDINDTYRITYESLIKLDAVFFNRWGQKLHSVSLSNASKVDDEPEKLDLWDGRVDGKYVKDGVYFVNVQAVGSDGVKYDIKKAVNVLKGFNEYGDSTGGK